MPRERTVNREHANDALRVTDTHVGLYDVHMRRIWIARRDATPQPAPLNHAQLLVGVGPDDSAAEKDRFLCFWFHPPHDRPHVVQGRTLAPDEGHLMVRLDPHWDHFHQRLLAPTETAYLRYNLDQQYRWAQRIYHAYARLAPPFTLNWHMIAPRPEDSMFALQRPAAPAPSPPGHDE